VNFGEPRRWGWRDSCLSKRGLRRSGGGLAEFGGVGEKDAAEDVRFEATLHLGASSVCRQYAGASSSTRLLEELGTREREVKGMFFGSARAVENCSRLS
jgi:hypothetical protein